MTTWNLKKEEAIMRKKLLYDGHGTGDDKRLVLMMKAITKFCLVEEPVDQVEKSHITINKLIAQSIAAAERNEKLIEVCQNDFDTTLRILSREEQDIEQAKNEVEKARLDLEYEMKAKSVNELPRCDETELKIRALDEKRISFKNKIERHNQQLAKIVSICDEFEGILSE